MTDLSKLRVYQRARAACTVAYHLAREIGDSELRDQMKRAAISVVLNIAEGRGRSSDVDFARFLVIARGSTTELTAQVGLASDLGMIESQEGRRVVDELAQITGMLSALIARLRNRS